MDELDAPDSSKPTRKLSTSTAALCRARFMAVKTGTPATGEKRTVMLMTVGNAEMKPDVPWVFIVWFPHSRRSEMFARTLGGRLHCIHHLQRRGRWQAPIRYVLNSISTLNVLLKERPQAVHVQNPPFVSSLIVFIYCRLVGTQFAIDHHSAAFSHMWAWALPVQRFLARQAVTNIVTNQHWADIIHSWDAHATIMGDAFLPQPKGGSFPVSERFNIAFVCSLALDEPVGAVVESAAELPDVHVYVTGDTRRRPKSAFDYLPANVTFTGFLPDAQYIALLRAVDAVLVLTKRDHTLQLGGCEAASVAQPLITSDWPFLRKFFPKGTVYVENTADGIREGILTMQKEQRRLKREMELFRDTARQEWRTQLDHLKEVMAGAIHG